MKEFYERTELDIIEFLQDDVIMTSEQEGYEDPEDQYMVPIR